MFNVETAILAVVMNGGDDQSVVEFRKSFIKKFFGNEMRW